VLGHPPAQLVQLAVHVGHRDRVPLRTHLGAQPFHRGHHVAERADDQLLADQRFVARRAVRQVLDDVVEHGAQHPQPDSGQVPAEVGQLVGVTLFAWTARAGDEDDVFAVGQAVRAHFGAFGHGGGGHGRVPAGGQPVGRGGGQGPRETGGEAVTARGSLAFEQAGGHFSSTTSTITDWK
jgi:hypothetical protein